MLFRLCSCFGPHICCCGLAQEKNYAFLEFRGVEEASNCMSFDGIAFRDSYLKVQLSVTRHRQLTQPFVQDCFWHTRAKPKQHI